MEPELYQNFQSALDVVRGDLADLPEEGPDTHCTLHIPVEHLESWIHALNQARLALGARYDVTDEDMDDIPTVGEMRERWGSFRSISTVTCRSGFCTSWRSSFRSSRSGAQCVAGNAILRAQLAGIHASG